jgi:hypothetical protein
MKLVYGLTQVDWQELFEKQGKKCAICGSIEPGGKRGWQTDHDHKTGNVRGILCISCNFLVGWLEKFEAPRVVISRAMSYLSRREGFKYR